MAFFHRKRPETFDDLRLVVGLGNPGSRYAGTRHNIGAMAIAHVAERHGLRLGASKHAAHIARAHLGVPLVLAVPDTFMNESGVAVSRLVRYYRVPVTRTLIVCDDLDIPFGTVRLRPNGSSGGNNGLKSIVNSLGTQDFPRLRLGIGRPAYGAVDHVLGKFPPEEERLLPELFDIVEGAIRCALETGVHEAMNRYNRDWMGRLTGAEPPVTS